MNTETVPGADVTAVRRALLAESEDFYKRRQPYRKAMQDATTETERDAALDTYEGFVTAGCYGLLLSAFLRTLEEDHGPTYAEDFAAAIADVMENGNECLEDANDDLDAAAGA